MMRRWYVLGSLCLNLRRIKIFDALTSMLGRFFKGFLGITEVD